MKEELRPPWGANRGDHTRKLTWTQWLEVFRQIDTREKTTAQAARDAGISVPVLYRKRARYERWLGKHPRRDPLRKWLYP